MIIGEYAACLRYSVDANRLAISYSVFQNNHTLVVFRLRGIVNFPDRSADGRCTFSLFLGWVVNNMGFYQKDTQFQND